MTYRQGMDDNKSPQTNDYAGPGVWPQSLERQRSVFTLARAMRGLTVDSKTEGFAAFVSVLDEDDATRVRTIEMRSDDWVDMGRPTTITVTVEPGDALNDLAGARQRVEQAQKDVIDQVTEARRSGKTWADIGIVFGISRQAAWEAYAKHMPRDVTTNTDAWVKRVAESDAEWAALTPEDRDKRVDAAIVEGREAGFAGATVNWVIGTNDDGSVYVRAEQADLSTGR